MSKRTSSYLSRFCAIIPLAGLLFGVSMVARAAGDTFLGGLKTVATVASTVPANGDVNPYGVARVRATIGNLHAGHILVSNFNDSSNAQGTGTTIMDVAPDGSVSVFAQINPATLPGPCPGGVGLTTALVVLQTGWVIVGSLPTADGTSATAQAGCLLVLDNSGKVVETFSGDPINGPWDMTVLDLDLRVVLFFTNVLNGTVAAGGNVANQGTVVRMLLGVSTRKMPSVISTTVVGSGFAERTDPDALVVGPTGVGLDRTGALYVADTVNDRIAVIPRALFRSDSAGTGLDVSTGGSLSGPLGLAIAPNGDIVTVNAGDGNIVETTPTGDQVATKSIDSSGSPPGAGALFGLAIQSHQGIYFVDDATNTLNLLH